MTQCYLPLGAKTHSAKQAGVVLFIALIALIVMSLAAVALIRSVDTNTLIAGNLGFKQSALVSSDSGVETALTWLGSESDTNAKSLQDNRPSDGYYANFSQDGKNRVDISTKKLVQDSSGNTVSFVIERMCTKIGVADNSHCLFGPPGEDENSKSNCDLSNPCLGEPTGGLLYRITTKVTGPKNTVTYSQAFVY
jgi:Tfp pilus assembly protein PilX